MKSLIVFFAVFLIFPFYAKEKKLQPGVNIFSDSSVQRIYDLCDHRDSRGLEEFLTVEDPSLRRMAALAFGSVQSPDSVEKISVLLSDEDTEVRKAAVYALGQTGQSGSESVLLGRYEAESSDAVKASILEALGKCGGDRTMKLLCNEGLDSGSDVLHRGRMLGFFRFVLRNKIPDEGIRTILKTMKAGHSEEVRFYAANCLSRSKDIDLSGFFNDIRTVLAAEDSDRVKMHLILAAGKCRGNEPVQLLRSLIAPPSDYRVKVNLIRAMKGFEYGEFSRELLNFAGNGNYHISVTAAEVLLEKGIAGDFDKYLAAAGKSKFIRSAANLFRLSLRLATDKSEVSALIREYYRKTDQAYDKGLLISALSEDPMNYGFIENEVFNSGDRFISSSGIAALSDMLLTKAWVPSRVVTVDREPKELIEVFAGIFFRGLQSGEISMVSVSSAALREPRNGFSKLFREKGIPLTVLDKARDSSAPEIRIEIEKVLDFFRGAEKAEYPDPSPPKALDWDLIRSIPEGQKVKIITGEGEIVVELLIGESPGSVSNFISMIKNGKLSAGRFHRVVPNFVIQGGCPEGSGWGGPGYRIRSEFMVPFYEEGSLGMASSGKDTEGSQWFITHAPTPHLDGRYTIFGRVVRGMGAVHRIQAGTIIKGYKIL